MWVHLGMGGGCMSKVRGVCTVGVRGAKMEVG